MVEVCGGSGCMAHLSNDNCFNKFVARKNSDFPLNERLYSGKIASLTGYCCGSCTNSGCRPSGYVCSKDRFDRFKYIPMDEKHDPRNLVTGRLDRMIALSDIGKPAAPVPVTPGKSRMRILAEIQVKINKTQLELDALNKQYEEALNANA